MIKTTDEHVDITINSEELVKAIAFLTDMSAFCSAQTEESVKETVDALTVAIETMSAFWSEHFADLTDDEVGIVEYAPDRYITQWFREHYGLTFAPLLADWRESRREARE